jgi:hypothetical protein
VDVKLEPAGERESVCVCAEKRWSPDRVEAGERCEEREQCII